MALTLSSTVEAALVAILSTGSTALAAANPQTGNSSEKVALPWVVVSGSAAGREFAFQTGLYEINVTVSAENKATASPTPDELIAEANRVFAGLNRLSQREILSAFAPHGLLALGVIPSQATSSDVNGDNRRSSCGLSVICRLNS